MPQRVQGSQAGWKEHTQGARAPAIGGMAFTGNVGGVITDNPGAGTFVPIGNGQPAHPLFTLDPSLFFAIGVVGANETQNQSLIYTGSLSLCAILTCSLSFQDPALGAFGTAAKLQQNGVDIPNSEQEAQTGGLITSADSLTIQGGTLINPGDTFRPLVANMTDGGNFIISSCHLTCVAL